MTKLYKVEVRWAKGKPGTDNVTGRWEVRSAEGIRPFTIKLNAVRIGRQVAKCHQPSTLIIYKMNGQVQEERTWPRSRDPRRSKG